MISPSSKGIYHLHATTVEEAEDPEGSIYDRSSLRDSGGLYFTFAPLSRIGTTRGGIRATHSPSSSVPILELILARP